MPNHHHYGTHHFTAETITELLRDPTRAILPEAAKTRIRDCRARVDALAMGERAVYGINTGFGPLCDVQISPAQTGLLQRNLLMSHAVGVGTPIDRELSRLMLICKVHALARGHSGVRLALVERLLYFLENDLIPVVPSQGSVGASGDLAPLAHLFLPLIGEGEFWTDRGIRPAAEVLAPHELPPFDLHAKEGLALINGTQFILAHALLGLDRMRYLLDLADLIGAMSLEGFQGNVAPFDARLHELRPFDGTKQVAARLRALLAGSENLASQQFPRVQDPYSLRCMPQVHGASRNAFLHLEQLTEIELNSVTDNPIVVSETEAISGGNFHGQPLALALDYATLAAAELGNISDRRSYLLLDGKYGLPRLLTPNPGLNSGLLIVQYTSAALVTENKTLCFPASADSVPTSMGQEDHVSMGSISGRKFLMVLDNLERILAIELLCAAQAIEFRRPNRCAPRIEENWAILRARVPKLADDRMLKPDIDAAVKLVQQRVFSCR